MSYKPTIRDLIEFFTYMMNGCEDPWLQSYFELHVVEHKIVLLMETSVSITEPEAIVGAAEELFQLVSRRVKLLEQDLREATVETRCLREERLIEARDHLTSLQPV